MNTYEFKDILIGFREEYLTIKEKLDDIEKNIKILDLKLNKCKVLLNDENNMISCYFFEQEKNIISAIINIEKHLGMPLYHLDNLCYDTNINLVYHFRNNIKKFHIIIEDIKEFNNKLLSIFETNFLNNFKSNIETIYNDKIYNLDIKYNSLKQEVLNGNNSIRETIYYPNKDLIKIDYIDSLNNNLLQTILKIKYKKTLFNEYQRSLIDNNHKEIELFEDTRNNRLFEIKEENKKLILVNKF